ncbi:hypothetical protein BU17DRAFT_56677 [Hysterangium stoloniferum]|nr:hypothetical protein BU17DRAFT_56677 [Hysterangium stoloniferum]
MKANTTISPRLASTYRLFLRGISASVLHHGPTKRTLRKLYRKTFSEARQVEDKLSSTDDCQPRGELEQWLVKWNQRIDNTLHLLHSSATNRGLSHHVTRNLGLLMSAYLREPKRPVWNPQAPPKLPKPFGSKSLKQDSKASFNAIAFRTLSEAVRLAEGYGDLTLGTIPRRR